MLYHAYKNGIEFGSIHLILPVPPISNHRLKPSVRKTKTGRSYIGMHRTKTATNYQRTVQLICLKGNIKPYDGDVIMSIIWYREAKMGDVPDRWKDLCDALNGFAYHDDKQIKIFRVERCDMEKNNPRIEVMIRKTIDEE